MPQLIYKKSAAFPVPSEGASFTLHEVTDVSLRVFANGNYALTLDEQPIQPHLNDWTRFIASGYHTLSVTPLKGCSTLFIELTLKNRQTGEEIDPVPLKVDIPPSPALSLAEQIRAIMQRELQGHADMQDRGQPLLFEDDDEEDLPSLYTDTEAYLSDDPETPPTPSQQKEATEQPEVEPPSED